MTKPPSRKAESPPKAQAKKAKAAVNPIHKSAAKPTRVSSQAQPLEPSVVVHIPASAEYVRVARLAVTGVASRMDFSYEEIEDIKLAVAEACNNAILHATLPATHVASTRQPAIVITVTPYKDRLEISVADEGLNAAAKLQKAARRAAVAREQDPSTLPESGFGLLLIQSLMDTVEHGADAASNTTIRMTKYLRGHQELPRKLPTAG